MTKKFDKDGKFAAVGKINEIILEQAIELYINSQNKKKLSFDTRDFDISFSIDIFFPKILKKTLLFFFKYSEIPEIILLGELSPPIASTAITTDFDI